MFAHVIAGWNGSSSGAVHPRPRPEQEDGKPQPPFLWQLLEDVKSLADMGPPHRLLPA
jgi:hypothetical protein